jgi:hypothetical protein
LKEGNYIPHFADITLSKCISEGGFPPPDNKFMPFKSLKQQRYLFIHEPALAKRWAKKYGTFKKSNRLSKVKSHLNKLKKNGGK